MWICEALTPWGVRVSDGVNVAQVVLDYGVALEDVTGQACADIPLAPNMFVARLRLTAANLEAIEADPLFEVIWCEEEVEDAPI